jgi:hypothetical protein
LRDGYRPDEDRAHFRFRNRRGDELLSSSAFLVDVRRVGRHRARGGAADVGGGRAGDVELGGFTALLRQKPVR